MTKRKPDWIDFVVEGNGPFPIDMLRYDACYPASVDDAEKIVTHLEFHAPYRVTLRHVISKGENPLAKPTRGRWASFGWAVVLP